MKDDCTEAAPVHSVPKPRPNTDSTLSVTEGVYVEMDETAANSADIQYEDVTDEKKYTQLDR